MIYIIKVRVFISLIGKLDDVVVIIYISDECDKVVIWSDIR